MEPLGWIIIAIIGIGVLVVGFVCLSFVIAYWWFAVPFILVFVAGSVGGWLGIFFSIGLIVIIAGIVQGMNSINKK